MSTETITWTRATTFGGVTATNGADLMTPQYLRVYVERDPANPRRWRVRAFAGGAANPPAISADHPTMRAAKEAATAILATDLTGRDNWYALCAIQDAVRYA
jgi:hypothetical protein